MQSTGSSNNRKIKVQSGVNTNKSKKNRSPKDIFIDKGNYKVHQVANR